MNLALFVTHDNLEQVRALVPILAERQQQTVNGCCLLIHSSTIPSAIINEMAARIFPRFRANALLPVQSNSGHPNHAKLASMFGRFLLGAYSRYPGAWLLMDEPAEPVVDNFMQAAERQHGAFGGKMTGRAVINKGACVPVGPVTLELPQNILRFLRFPTGDSWRTRAQHLFLRAGFQLVPADQWLFSMGEPSHVQDAAAGKDDELSDEELVRRVTEATGKKPHHFTGRDKLLAMLEEATTAAV